MRKEPQPGEQRTLHQAASAPRHQVDWKTDLEEAFVIKRASSRSQQGASCCWLSQHGGHNCGFRTEREQMGASQHLKDGCQFRFLLPFDLFFSPDVHILQSLEEHDTEKEHQSRGLGCSSQPSDSSLQIDFSSAALVPLLGQLNVH